MKDLMEMAYEIATSGCSKEKEKELFIEAFIKELSEMKNSDIASHFSCNFEVIKQQYTVIFSFPARLDELNSF